MKTTIRKHATAEADLLDHFVYLGMDSDEAADRFLDRAAGTFEFLAANPHVGRLVDTRSKKVAGTRWWPVSTFPNHLVFYRPTRTGIEVLRVLHGASDWSRHLHEPGP